MDPQRLDPRDGRQQPGGRADPGSQRAESQAGEPDREPSARPPPAETDDRHSALAGHQHDHDEAGDAVHDRDRRAARRPRRLGSGTREEGKGEGAEQSEVRRPPRPRPGHRAGGGADAIDHHPSGVPGNGCGPAVRSSTAGPQEVSDQPLYAAAFRVAACSLSQLLSVEIRRSR